jgi:hypothetical protein
MCWMGDVPSSFILCSSFVVLLYYDFTCCMIVNYVNMRLYDGMLRHVIFAYSHRSNFQRRDNGYQLVQ